MQLAQELQSLPRRLSRDAHPTEIPRLHLYTTSAPRIVGERVAQVPISPLPGLDGFAGPGEDAIDFTLARAEQLFRMRWLSANRAAARVLLLGKTEGSSGRMPGILEELVLTLALGRPVYLIGAFGGATRVLGELLGLSAAPAPFKLDGAKEDLAARVRANPGLFRPAGYENLPLLTEDAVSFPGGYAVGGPRWPENGLSVEENRALFNLALPPGPEEAVDQAISELVALVERGLLRRFR